MIFVRDGYVCNRLHPGTGKLSVLDPMRNTWIIGQSKKDIVLGNLSFPKVYWGKRIRLKVEVVDDLYNEEYGLVQTELDRAKTELKQIEADKFYWKSKYDQLKRTLKKLSESDEE